MFLYIPLVQCAAPWFFFLDKEIKSLLCSADPVLLSPTEQGLQKQRDIDEKYCQNWTPAVNMRKTAVMIFQQCPRTNTSEQ